MSDNSKNFFAQNIKLLRNRQKWTQHELAEKLCVTRSKLNALESGQTKTPSPEDLLGFADVFKMSIDTLIRIDLSKISELKLRELQAGNDIYIKGGNLRVLAISVDATNTEQVEYIPLKAKAGYVAGFNDPEYIASLPKYALPNLPQGSTFRIFPSTGDSMLPIPEGSDIIARYVEDWSNIKPETLCVVILRSSQDIVFKKASLRDRTLLLSSLNSLYASYEVNVEEVLEIWQFHAYLSQSPPLAEPDIQSLVRAIKEMQADIRVIKSK